MDNINDALDIAKKELRRCYGKQGIYAGLNHFKDYWARDSMFACFGALELKDYDIVKKNLSLLIENRSRHGQIPLRVGRTVFEILLSMAKLRNENIRRPLYTFDFNNKHPADQNSLLIIAAYNYAKKTKDKGFCRKTLSALEKIMLWNLKQDKDKDLLVEEKELCSWADSVRKKGKVLYTNVCHCYALKCMAEIFSICKLTAKSRHYKEMHNKVRDKINELFWAGEHYLDWIDNNDNQYNYFSSDGNFLAVLWDIADSEKARHIEEAAHIFDIEDIPSQCVHPPYPKKIISLQTRMIGLGDYHNGLSWLWLGCINALAKHKVGRKKEAVLLLKDMAELMIEHKGVYEVYENTGKPVKRLIYRSEQPFAWSAGMFIYAVKKIMKI
ncbi:hypothetical protein JXC34_02440 [Candidatus Woesearchaeota archaeon]|nr:hypothetical protein [Candidatus Woesearchaeota archaeon]